MKTKKLQIKVKTNVKEDKGSDYGLGTGTGESLVGGEDSIESSCALKESIEPGDVSEP